MRIRTTFLIASLLLVPAALQMQAQKLSSLTTQLTSVTGDQTSVATLGTGRVTVVSFWATWCKPCKEEMKAMQPIFEKLKDKITYVAISIDNTKTMAKVAPYIKSQGYTFNVLLDPNSEFFNAVNGTNVPYTLVFNADGSLHSKHDGYFEGDATKLEEELKTMIGSSGQ
ncbi:MAG TPA: TlpA disulfide reductase family protein [Candidatus Kapabacteria bacterium]|nr:TlpA disulfide reductase family protein [Candidatus Kapabacteria bacterium]